MLHNPSPVAGRSRQAPHLLHMLSHAPYDVLMLFFAALDESTLPIPIEMQRLGRGGYSQMVLADAIAAQNILRIVS